MLRKGMTIKEATEYWVREMNAIPQGMIERLMENGIDEWREVTAPICGDEVYFYGDIKGGRTEIVEIDSSGDHLVYKLELDDGTIVCDAVEEEFEVINENGFLPMWGTMWSFGDRIDDWWLEERDGIRLMSECGFRIYCHDEFGYFFGIDGAGYDFYESHWIPLYKARGLHWHDKAAEAAEYMVEHGTKNTHSGNYHFEFNEIGKMFETEVDDAFVNRVYEIVFDRYGYKVSELITKEDFDFMFYTCFCPMYEEE